MTVTAAHSVFEQLVAGMVDYAGLFPPAALSMPEAVANFAGYHRDRESWALGRFVVPVSRLAEFSAVAAQYVDGAGGAGPWRLSVLMNGTADAAFIEPFNRQWSRRVIVDAAETKASLPSEIASLAAAIPAGVTLYVEVSADAELTSCLKAIRVAGAAAKIRTGGVTAESFPHPDAVIAFIQGCIDTGVSFKATAGLHHPVRGTYRLTYAPDSAVGEMYGFLNVFACAAALQSGASREEAGRVLLAGGDDLSVTPDGVIWKGVTLSLAQLAGVRTLVRGFGSCSFREPVDELAALRGKVS